MSTGKPQRSIRVPESLWNAAKVAAAAEYRTVTDVVIESLVTLVRRHKKGTN